MVGTKESAAKANITKAENAIKYARITGLPKGTKVKVNTPQERRYHGKTGEVIEHNMGETGVDFGSGALVWFLPNQLIKV